MINKKSKMTIYECKNIDYIKRVLTYSKYRILKPLILYVIPCVISKSINPFEFNIIFLTIFSFYLIVFLILIFWRTRFFVKKISYFDNSNTFELVIDDFNCEKTYNLNSNDLSTTIELYDTITRSVNQYLKLEVLSLNMKIKQFDYFPWSDIIMKEVKNEIDKIKLKHETI